MFSQFAQFELQVAELQTISVIQVVLYRKYLLHGRVWVAVNSFIAFYDTYSIINCMAVSVNVTAMQIT